MHIFAKVYTETAALWEKSTIQVHEYNFLL
jgi:hypothetical protein